MKITTFALLGFLAASLGLAVSNSWAASFSLTPTDDAGVREENPETFFGGSTPIVAGPIGELTVRTTGGQNRASLVKFDLTGITAADVNSGKADFWLRAHDVDNSNADGIRIYGLNPGKDNNQPGGWDENTVHYRDSGFHTTTPPQATNGPLIQLTDAACGFISGGDCPPAGTQYGYGADPNLATAAPGFVYENAPYSRAAVVRANGGDTTAAATQPAYNTVATSANYPDVVGFPLAQSATAGWSRAVEDLQNSGDTTFLGYMNWEDPTVGANPSTLATEIEGHYLHFTSRAPGQSDPTSAMLLPQVQSNEALLKAWLIDLINNGDTSATLFLTNKNIGGTQNEDLLPGRNSNKIFRTKEKALLADLSDAGNYTPLLFIGAAQSAIPEPSSLVLVGLSLGLAALGRRR